MFKRTLLTGVAILLTTSIALADCPGGCPSLPTTIPSSGTATNNTTNNVQGVSNPSGVLVNQQNNFTTQGQVQYGNGVACQDNSINPYIGISNSGAAGFNYNTTTFGVAATILLGPNHNRCGELANVIIAQHRNDTVWGNMQQCVNLAHANVDLRSAALHGLCDGLAFNAPAPPPVVIQQPAPAPAREVMRVAHLSNFTPPSCLPDVHRDADLALLHAKRAELRTLHPSDAIILLHDKLSHACNVTSREVIDALDG